VANTQATIVGDLRSQTLIGTAWNDTLLGAAGDDVLIGGAGADLLVGGTGNDRLQGGAGGDVYAFSRRDGSDTIVENDASPQAVDILQFHGDINPAQLWFSTVNGGRDLKVLVVGTTDSVVVQDWFTAPAHQVEEIRSGTGEVLLATQVNDLVSAMAGFAAPPAGQLSLSQSLARQLQPALAAAWKAA
jgi:Ca2+-binding RTX toxin-like protein